MDYLDLISELHQRTNLTRGDIRKVLAALPDALLSLTSGDMVITPLGTFFTRHREAYKARLPMGEIVTVPSKISIEFRPNFKLKITEGDPQFEKMQKRNHD